MVFFSFLEFFCIFFVIFYYASGRNETQWYFLCSLFLGIFQPILARNEPSVVFFKFLNFFPISLEFSNARRVGTERNRTERQFLFSLFLGLFQPILTWNESIMVFLEFLEFFCYFFGIFYYASGRNETKRYFLYSLFLGIFQHILAWNEAIMVFFNFLNFFFYFFGIFYYA